MIIQDHYDRNGIPDGFTPFWKKVRLWEDSFSQETNEQITAENERMHLMTFMTLRNPSLFFRAIILGAQGVFYNLFCAFARLP
jgi:hypothetical protein